MKITEKDIFMCYSIPLRNYLKSKGIKYIVSGRDFRSGLPFYAYFRNDELMDIVRNQRELGITPKESSNSLLRDENV